MQEESKQNTPRKPLSSLPRPALSEMPSSSPKKPKQTFQMSLGALILVIVIISLISGALGGFLLSGSGPLSSITNSIQKTFSLQKSASNVDTKSVSIQEESQTVDVVKKSNEAVVSIVISKDVSKYYSQSQSPFEQFFYGNTDPTPQGQQTIGGGSGFIISSDGLIVTNKHVVSDEDADYTVFTNDRTSHKAKVVAIDPANDLAFLKIETTEKLATLSLGDSETVQIGQTVIAIGNALGEYRNTVTKGIVSGLARTVTAGDGQGSQETLENVIQTDAAINFGNSGGPLLNLEGQVIGINTAVNTQGQLIGFAIPSNEIKKAVESVQKTGRIVRPMLGVRYTLVTDQLQKQNSLSVNYGALVVKGTGSTQPAVVSGSPADKAGIVENDIILKLNDEKITQTNSLAKVVAKHSPGDQITLTVLHNKEEKTIQVTLDELPSN